MPQKHSKTPPVSEQLEQPKTDLESRPESNPLLFLQLLFWEPQVNVRLERVSYWPEQMTAL